MFVVESSRHETARNCAARRGSQGLICRRCFYFLPVSPHRPGAGLGSWNVCSKIAREGLATRSAFCESPFFISSR